jgi:hypothetical protein
MELKNYGYIPDEIKDEDYVFGGLQLPDEILQPSGNWADFLPVDEFQRKNNIETQNCTAFGTLNCLETLIRRKFGGTPNYSDRAVGIAAGTSPIEGNTPQRVIETIRKEPCIVDEEDLPFDDSIKTPFQYFTPNPLSSYLISKAKLWPFAIGHEWVFKGKASNKPQLLMEALKRSPLGVSVCAWKYDSDRQAYVKPEGMEDNHWVEMYAFEEGNCWYIFDHYDATHKKLVWDYDFEAVKRYYVTKALTPQEQEGVLIQIISLANQAIQILKSLINKNFDSKK